MLSWSDVAAGFCYRTIGISSVNYCCYTFINELRTTRTVRIIFYIDCAEYKADVVEERYGEELPLQAAL